ncbi:hypothetical protein [Herbiconiux ginsengi]|uniref:Uncharacterized protein n=1 Tax=Herbiconiux ginsengi TaxID=381665 RepID=A0A1H3U1N7_9MICO|nr:hypothetical protein [Herbiconiux ginsengi]SDZ56252.1 hypothetical protein SAMN05216554_0009 [Herbiconiux ginsengi]
MYYNDWSTIPYTAFMIALFVGAVVLLVLLGRLMVTATRALQSYRRVQELRIDLLIADGNEDPKL